MRILRIILITLMICAVSIPSLNCASESEPMSEEEVATVQRGDLRIEITASGNLELSHTEDLAFEISGTVEEVLVEVGDTAEERQVLAKLDTSEWERELRVAERQLTAAERQLTAKERQLTAAERQLTAKERDVLQSQINVNNAQLALEKTLEESTDRLEIEVKELQRELARGRVDDAQTALEDAQTAIGDAQTAIEDAQTAVEDAQETLDEVKSASPVITAPFAGFITKVNVSGGDEVKKGTVAVTLVDPAKFEANIMVSEMDISQVRPGGEASVQIDAMPTITLPAKVTSISPTATIQEGVVNYEVQVQVELLKPVKPGKSQEDTGKGEGKDKDKQSQKAQGEQGSLSTAPQVSQLRGGLSVSVSILVEEKKDVLLVLNKAIVRQKKESFVQVLKDGVVEERSIKTGTSDWKFTEVTDGLSEGEEVLITQATSTGGSTTQMPGGQRVSVPGGRRGLVR